MRSQKVGEGCSEKGVVVKMPLLLLSVRLWLGCFGALLGSIYLQTQRLTVITMLSSRSENQPRKIPKRIVPENLSILHICLPPWIYLFRAITRYLFAKGKKALEKVFPDHLEYYCILIFLL